MLAAQRYCREIRLPRGAAHHVTVVIVSALAVTIAFAVGLAWPPSAAELRRQAQAAYDEQDDRRAVELAAAVLQQSPEDPEALLIAGRASARGKDYDRAVRYFEQMPDSASDTAQAARLAKADIWVTHRPQPSKAAATYRRILDYDPDNVLAHHRMAYLLGLAGRHEESIPHRLALIKAGQVEAIHLYLLCNGASILENVDELHALHEAAPDDPWPLLGLARQAIDEQRFPEAESLLRELTRREPQLIAAHVTLGEVLLESRNPDEFRRWHDDLPEQVTANPRYWNLLARWSQQQSQPEAVVRCSWEAARLDPNQQQAIYQLAQLLPACESADAAAPFLRRSKQLDQYFAAVTAAWTSNSAGDVQAAAEHADALGLAWEAYGWARLMLDYDPRAAWASALANRLEVELATLPLERTRPEANPARKIDLSHFPKPQLSGSSPDTDAAAPLVKGRFRDDAAAAGLDFNYFNGAPRDEQSHRMYEFNGGGVAAIDYDGDGWPDLHFTQGAEWPPEKQAREHTDRLFRNRGDGRFEDVTNNARINDTAFSAGVTVGDFDNDGFPDLYIANIGANRLLRNNGDGTFTDVTANTGTAGDDWSSSCLLADLNRDGLPDLYVVNYLSGDDVFTRLCPNERGEPRSCSPRQFPAAQDRLYLNTGDGRFVDVTADSGIQRPDGKGLGIVAFRSGEPGELDLFIANDAVPNFYFTPAGVPSPGQIRFEEQALVSGLAVNAAGRPEACMGVAAGDADGDGRIDLFVTNFHNETNTLYRQSASRIFDDTTRAANLHAASLKMLGFGTQFLDAELDGDLDLIVTNGHIDDLSAEGIAFEMPPQLFLNDGQGRFTEQAGADIGTYFTGEYLGRGLARLDWNRDGREDAAITHLDAPAALLTNETHPAGNWLSLALRGTTSSRDAVGATVEVQCAERRIVRQLTAGDGFQASNERKLVIGVGSAERVDQLTIRWPSGESSRFADVPLGRELLCVEGQRRWRELPAVPAALP